MSEHAKHDLIQQPTVQSCHFIHFIIILWQLVWRWLLIYRDGSNNVVQIYSFIKPWTVCSNMHEQVCRQHCSSWPAQPCPSLSTGKNKLCVFTCVPNVNYLCLSIRLMIYFCWIKFEAECKTLKENLETLKHDHERLTAENNKLRAQVDGLLALKKVAFYFKIFYLLELNQKWLVNVV